MRPPRLGEAFSRSNLSRRRSPELRLADARRSGDPRERAALIEEYLPLARSLARRLRTSNDSPEDLVQVACVGLVKAVDRFDPERGLRFSSFAVPTITGELRRYLRDRTWRLHIPRGLQDLIVALGPVTEALSGELQRSPTVDELAKRMRVSPEAILDARQAGYSQFGCSLDEPAHQDGRETLAETLGSDDRELARAEGAIVLEGWLAQLPEREREILHLRFKEELNPERNRRAALDLADARLADSARVIRAPPRDGRRRRGAQRPRTRSRTRTTSRKRRSTGPTPRTSSSPGESRPSTAPRCSLIPLPTRAPRSR